MKVVNWLDNLIESVVKKKSILNVFVFLTLATVFLVTRKDNAISLENSVINARLIDLQTIVFFILFLLAIPLSIKEKTKKFFVFLLFSMILIIQYGHRLTEIYLFQDDWYHTLAITRLGLKGLFIPFVDHITPIWRLLQLTLLKVFGGYYYMVVLTYSGVFAIAALGILIYDFFLRRGVKYAFVLSSLLVFYPGYPAVLFWVSTNAIVYSAMFGLIALFLSEDSQSENSMQKQLKISFFLILSYLSWTTGLVFSLYVLASAFLGNLDSYKKISSLVSRQTLQKYVAGILALGIFFVIRKITLSIYTEEFIQKTLWVSRSLSHGHDFSILRPIMWPFISIFDGLVTRGVFQDTAANNTVWEPFGRGFAVFLISIFIAYKARANPLSVLKIFLFGLLSFFVIFMGRGAGDYSHKTPHGYLDYAIGNDWYRISAFTGVLFLFGLYTRSLTDKANRILRLVVLLLILPLFLGVFKWNSLLRDHPIRHMSRQMTVIFEEMACLSKLNLDEKEILFASAHVFLPMFKSNPVNYWLSYEPSWFDLYVNSSPEKHDLKFSDEENSIVVDKVLQSCPAVTQPRYLRYALRSDIPPTHWHEESVPAVHENSNGKVIFRIESEKNAIRDFSVLVLHIKISEKNREAISFKINGLTVKHEFINFAPEGSDTIITIDIKLLNLLKMHGEFVEVEITGPEFSISDAKFVGLPGSQFFINKYK